MVSYLILAGLGDPVVSRLNVMERTHINFSIKKMGVLFCVKRMGVHFCFPFFVSLFAFWRLDDWKYCQKIIATQWNQTGGWKSKRT